MKVLPLGAKVLPISVKQTLQEDDDQGEMDGAFVFSVVLYSLFILCRKLILSGEDYDQVGKFVLVMSNLFAFFPIMQAQGLWLKMLLIVTCFSSIMWHWTEVGMKLPGNEDIYGDVDACFSIMSIVSYCIQWVPHAPIQEYTEKDFFTRNFLGRPKQTAEWRCRFTPLLCTNILITIMAGVFTMVFRDYSVGLALVFVAIAVGLSIYHLTLGVMTVGAVYRKKFAICAVCGIVFGGSAFIFQHMDDRVYCHSLWHTYVFASAYSFSRASDYLEFKN